MNLDSSKGRVEECLKNISIAELNPVINNSLDERKVLYFLKDSLEIISGKKNINISYNVGADIKDTLPVGELLKGRIDKILSSGGPIFNKRTNLQNKIEGSSDTSLFSLIASLLILLFVVSIVYFFG